MSSERVLIYRQKTSQLSSLPGQVDLEVSEMFLTFLVLSANVSLKRIFLVAYLFINRHLLPPLSDQKHFPEESFSSKALQLIDKDAL